MPICCGARGRERRERAAGPRWAGRYVPRLARQAAGFARVIGMVLAAWHRSAEALITVASRPGNRMLNARPGATWYRIIRHRGGAMEPAGRARVERRLAAILAADVAGYSRLIETDEEGTLARLKTLRVEVIDPKTIGQEV